MRGTHDYDRNKTPGFGFCAYTNIGQGGSLPSLVGKGGLSLHQYWEGRVPLKSGGEGRVPLESSAVVKCGTLRGLYHQDPGFIARHLRPYGFR
jgi:hypothetical protein